MPIRDHECVSNLGVTFFLTSSIMGWKHVFIKPILLDILINCLKFYQDKRQVKTVGYCLMPNHIHWELVTDVVDYPYSSCKYYETGEDGQGLEILNLL